MNELFHHGIKGQKWGVRRYQNYDGTYTAAGKKRYSWSDASTSEKAKRYFEGDTDSRRNSRPVIESLHNEYYSKLDEINKKVNYDFSKFNKLSRPIDKKYNKLIREEQDIASDSNRRERDKLAEAAFFGTKESKKQLSDLRTDIKELKSLYDKHLGVKSEAYKQAEKEYYKSHENDDGYGFSHYEWREGVKAYDVAYKKYEKASKVLSDRIDKNEKSIVENALSDRGSKPLSNISDADMDYYRSEIDQIARFNERIK